MHKDELIQMHTLLCQIKNYIESNGSMNGAFTTYKAMNISPIHVHRSKTEHKKAIFTLGKEIADCLSAGEENGAARMSTRMTEMLMKMERAKAN
ncbi:MAG TPA: UPF0058 family protein [Candidatus Thermoplasmatota archaeon]|nr:UPF0058 family protein [Candidatus Thermoplasmatota archaeon]